MSKYAFNKTNTGQKVVL